MFIWTLAHRGILIGENLRRRGWEGPSRCPLCCQEEKTTDHLLLGYPYAMEVWQLSLGLGAFTPTLPQETNALLWNWHSLCPFQTTKQGQLSTLWRMLPKFILWKIWIEKNNRLFREVHRSPAQVATRIKALFSESAPHFCKEKNSSLLEREEELWIDHLNLQDHQQHLHHIPLPQNWELRMEKQEMEEWKRAKNNYILSFDGASKGNPGTTGGGGILVSPTRLTNLIFAWGLGMETNNRAEALTLWQGLNQAITHNVRDLVILGDSRIIIQALIICTKVTKEKLQHILDKIQLLPGNLRNY
jgi:hypothetical protein